MHQKHNDTVEYSIIESGFSFTVKPVSDSLGISDGLVAVNNIIPLVRVK